MSESSPPPPADLLEVVAALIGDVGRSAQHARRYRDLATRIADPVFDRALDIGTAVRQQLRHSEPSSTDISSAIVELRSLLERCELAIVGLQASPLYQRAAACFAAGSTRQVAQLATAVFTDVQPYPDATRLFWPMPIGGKRPGAHFVTPEECAARIRAVATEGLAAASPPPELGADDTIGAVTLSDEHDSAEAPIALAFDHGALPAPVCRLAASGVALFYAARLQAPFRVRCAATVSDEWWAVRPDAYQTYLSNLRDALAPHGFAIEIES